MSGEYSLPNAQVSTPHRTSSTGQEVEYGLSPFTLVYSTSHTMSPHRNHVFSVGELAPVPIAPTYDDDVVSSSAFLPSIHQITSVDPTLPDRAVKKVGDEKNPRLANAVEALMMSGVVAIPEPQWKVPLATEPVMPPLRRCDSVLEFLKAMYDLLEAHRFLAKHARILLRNLSFYSVRRGPVPIEWVSLTTYDGVYRPKLISETLQYEKAPEARSRLESVAFRFEDAYRDAVGFQQESHDALAQIDYLRGRPGESHTISRAVSAGHFLPGDKAHRAPAPMPLIQNPRALAAYTAMHSSSDPGRLFYTHDYEREILKSVPYLAGTKNVHQPRHDVESAYWMIVAHIMKSAPIVEDAPKLDKDNLGRLIEERHRALLADQEARAKGERPPYANRLAWAGLSPDYYGNPASTFYPSTLAQSESAPDPRLPDDETKLSKMREFMQCIIDQQIPSHPRTYPSGDGDASAPKDLREKFFQELSTAEAWEGVLHPEMSSLAPMLARLTKVIAPEYEYLVIAREHSGVGAGKRGGGILPSDHLHEAVQRILIDQIFDMTEAFADEISGQSSGDVKGKGKPKGNATIPTHDFIERGEKDGQEAMAREQAEAEMYIPERKANGLRKMEWEWSGKYGDQDVQREWQASMPNRNREDEGENNNDGHLEVGLFKMDGAVGEPEPVEFREADEEAQMRLEEGQRRHRFWLQYYDQDFSKSQVDEA